MAREDTDRATVVKGQAKPGKEPGSGEALLTTYKSRMQAIEKMRTDLLGDRTPRTFDDMWREEKRRRQLELADHDKALREKGALVPRSGGTGVTFTGAGGRPYSVNKDLLASGGPVLVRDLQAARLREASEHAAFKALRAQQAEAARAEGLAKANYYWDHYDEVVSARQDRLIAHELARAEHRAKAEVLRTLRGETPPVAGPGSRSDGKASRVERRLAAGMTPDGRPAPQDFGAPGVRVARPNAKTEGRNHRGFGAHGSVPGVTVISSDAPGFVQELALKQTQRRQVVAQAEARRLRDARDYAIRSAAEDRGMSVDQYLDTEDYQQGGWKTFLPRRLGK